jgi:hypothetical protein
MTFIQKTGLDLLDIAMRRILVIDYSQSGDVTKVTDAFTRAFPGPGVEVYREKIQSLVAFPYPWGSLRRLYSVFPECFVGSPGEIRPLTFSAEDRFDLVILAFQVWHLAPSLPIQAFLRSDHAQVLKDTPVITLCVSRNMWHSASETMKQELWDADAFHIDNLVVTHQGPPFSTFVSVPRALLYGKRDRLFGIFPPANISEKDLARVASLGAEAASRLGDLKPPYHSLLAGRGTVKIKLRSIVPELIGWHLYRAGAQFVARVGKRGKFYRQLAIDLFLGVTLVVILVGIPLCVVLVFLLHPLLGRWIQGYARRLAEPSG